MGRGRRETGTEKYTQKWPCHTRWTKNDPFGGGCMAKKQRAFRTTAEQFAAAAHTSSWYKTITPIPDLDAVGLRMHPPSTRIARLRAIDTPAHNRFITAKTNSPGGGFNIANGRSGSIHTHTEKGKTKQRKRQNLHSAETRQICRARPSSKREPHSTEVPNT